MELEQRGKVLPSALVRAVAYVRAVDPLLVWQLVLLVRRYLQLIFSRIVGLR